MYKDTVHLRPHHLLCLPHFQGYGYSEDHIQACYTLQHQLYTSEYIIFKEHDILCYTCPKEDVCGQLVVLELDRHILSCTDTYYNIRYTIYDVYNTLLQNDKRYNVCQFCEWYTICSNYREEYGEDRIYQFYKREKSENESDQISHFSSLKNMRYNRMHGSYKDEQMEKCTQKDYIQQLRLQRWLEKRRRG